MSRASEQKLASLHGAVAEVLTAQVKHQEAETVFNEHGDPVETGDMVYTASPATMATAIKFLKDNAITCDIEQDENMNNLRDTLAKKQRHSRLRDAGGAAREMDVH